MENIESLFERDKKREEEFEKKKKELKKDKNKLNQYKELARGDKEASPEEVNEARLMLFMMGEKYTKTPTVEQKIEQIKKWGEGELKKETEYNALLKEKIKEKGLPQDLAELDDLMDQKDIELVTKPKDYDSDKEKRLDERKTLRITKKISSNIKKLYSKKPAKFEKEQRKLIGKFAKKFLKGEDRWLIEEYSRSEESIEQYKKIKESEKRANDKSLKKNFPYKTGKIPSYVANLLEEKGRIDLLYWDNPDEIVNHLKRMDDAGFPVSELSAEVWQCPAFIDALSDAQLFELTTKGNPAALGKLRENVAKNPWLLVGDKKNPDGKYEPKHGSGISRFVLKSAFALDPKALAKFFAGAQEIMPHAEKELTTEEEITKNNNTFEGWTREILSKCNAEEVLSWDDGMFRPKDKRTGKDNPVFYLFTKYAGPHQLALTAEGPQSENRKELLTQLFIEYQDEYWNKDTRMFIKRLEEKRSGKDIRIGTKESDRQETETAEKSHEESATPDEQTVEMQAPPEETKMEEKSESEIKIEELEKKLLEAHEQLEEGHEKLEKAIINKEQLATDVLIAFDEFKRISHDLSEEDKADPTYQSLEMAKKLMEESIGLTRITSHTPGIDYDPEKHRTDYRRPKPERGETAKVKEIIEDGYLLDGKVLRKPKVTLE